jgi:hypothetical protein
MSNKEDIIKVIDCTKRCRMTSTVRDSEYCTGEAKVVDGKIFYGCQEKIKSEPKEVRQFYVCELWDVGLKDSCNTCSLECINNKNEKLEEYLKEKKELEALIEELKPNMILHGVTATQVEKISSVYTKKNSSGERNQMGAEAIKTAKFANKALKMAMSGKRIDLALYTLYARNANKNIKKLKDKK